MDIEQRAYLVQAALEAYFPTVDIPLQHHNPYTLLIAVLLSAQCTDLRVNQVTPQLFALADTPQDMIKHSIEEIQAIIRPCGLSHTKAKAIWNLSRILCEEYKGQVIADWKALECLPGVGHKTASVVMSQAFGIPAFPVDTHIHRCAKRWGLSSGANVRQTEHDLKALYPATAWNKLHIQIILFARQYCRARQHDAAQCPICRQLPPATNS